MATGRARSTYDPVAIGVEDDEEHGVEGPDSENAPRVRSARQQQMRRPCESVEGPSMSACRSALATFPVIACAAASQLTWKFSWMEQVSVGFTWSGRRQRE